MTSKRGWLLLIIILAITIPTVHAAQPADCNNAGGIWCGPLPGGECVNYTDYQPTVYGTKMCTVGTSQNITVPHNKYFVFDKFEVLENREIWFTSTDNYDCSQYHDVTFYGGVGGLRGSPSGSGQNGGNGGSGGNVCNSGIAGTSGNSPGGAGGRSGALVHIYANNITNKGKISVAGIDGNNGVDAKDSDCNVWNACIGRGAGGGGGGGSGGVLHLVAPYITNSGQLIVKGADGGDGGKGTDDNGNNCGNSGDEGASGGGGGGGASGLVLTSAYIGGTIISGGGSGGAGACLNPLRNGASSPGSAGQPPSGVNIISSNQETKCSDAIDDDGDLLVDMDDPDCHLMTPIGQAGAEGWDTSIRSQYNLTSIDWYNPSALDGTDLSCGDDKSYILGEICYPINNPCFNLSNSVCNSNDACQWNTPYFGWEQPYCGLKNNCGSLNQSTCDSTDYCEWGVPACSANPKYCESLSQYFCELTDFCAWSNDECSYNGDNYAGCSEYSYPSNPKDRNIMCNALAGLCMWTQNLRSDYEACYPDLNCSAACVGPDSQCHYYSDNNDGSCVPNAPQGCYSQITSQTGCGSNGVEPCYQCTGDFSCSELLDEETCQTGNCFWQDCQDCWAYNKTTCQSSNNYCDWKKSVQIITSGVALGDLGFILPDQAYACFDNAVSAGNVSSLTEPGREFVWRSADLFSQQSPYLILQTDNTHFISNNLNWTYCDASGLRVYGDTGRLSEGQSFVPEFSDGKLSCVSTISLLNISVNGVVKKPSVFTCTSSNTVDCKNQANLNGKDAFCFLDSSTGDKISYTPGDFLETCGLESNCMIKNHVSGEWVGLSEYFDQYSTQNGWCSILGNNALVQCGSQGTTGQTTYGNDFISSALCSGRDTSACFPTGIDPTKSCQTIITSEGWSYNSEDRLCGSTKYCAQGSLVYSNENGTAPTCCYGETASCQTFTNNQCSAIGGELLPSYFDEEDIQQGEVTCLGHNPEGTTCCIGGMWTGNPNAFLGDMTVNESFVCYQQGDKDLLKECCGEGLCYNKDNPLKDVESLNPTKLYALAGVRLHTIMDFDSKQERIYKRVLNKPGGSKVDFTNEFKLKNWGGFNTLEFDISYNLPYVENITLFDGSGNKVTYNLSQYVTSGAGINRWLHVAIPLNDSELTLSNITKISFELGGSATTRTSILFDNFVLSDSTGQQNTENYYCTGDWKTWVKNLDGPSTNEGFFNDTEAPTLSEFGPYQFACDSIASFGWTGRLCCGDDTKKGQFGEFWADTAGACWNGTTITDDQTFAYALGSSNPTLEEKSLLFKDEGGQKNIWSCKISAQNYGAYNFSFNGLNSSNQNFEDSITEVDYFTIKGSWMCQEGGWVNLEDVNRIRLVATALSDYAEVKGKADEHTLFCGNYAELSNYMNLSSDLKDVVENACVLRLGKNKNMNEQIIFGLEINRQKTLQDFNQVLKRFIPFDSTSNLTCNNAPSNVSPNKFFTICEEITTPEQAADFSVYYNKPFNLIVMSDTSLNAGVFDNNNPFIVQMWYNFLNFFNRLFSSNNLPTLPSNLTQNQHISDFYISYQKQSANYVKQIVGVMEKAQNTNTIRIDYTNLNSNVSILKKAIEANYPGIQVNYSAQGYTQTIYIKGPNANWKMASSLLRLVGDKGTPTNFGQQAQSGSQSS